MTASRRSQRRASAFLLYQRDLTGSEFEDLYDAYRLDNGDAVTDFIKAHVEGAWGDRERLDRSIDAAADTWSTERMAVLEGSACGGRHRRGGRAGQALCVARGRGARQRGTREDRARTGGGDMSDDTIEELQRISSELDQLNQRLAAGGLEAADATELLEQITVLAQEAAAAIERRAETLDD